jgi:hypothetical protein
MSDAKEKRGRLPWQIHPALTAARLRIVAGIFRDVRRETVKVYEPSKGDIAWNIACTAYARTIWAISQAVLRDECRGWLSIVDKEGLAFVFGIGGVPIRFYSGDPEHPPERALQKRVTEMEAQYEAFDTMDDPTNDHAPDRYFRYIIGVKDLLVESVTLIQVNSRGEVHNPYRIDLDAAPSVVQFDTKSDPIVVPRTTKPRRRRKPGQDKSERKQA